MDIEDAVDKALNDIPDDWIIKEFLLNNKSEVTLMCLTEYNEAETMQMFKEEGIEEGIAQGIRNMIIGMLERGKEPESIAEFCDIPIEQVEEIRDSMYAMN